MLDILIRPHQRSLLIQQSRVQIRGRRFCDLATGEEAEGVDAVVGVDEDDIVGFRDVEDGVGGGGDGEGGAALDESPAVVDDYYGAEGLRGRPGAGVET